MATYSCLIARTTTGEIIDELPMADFTWDDSLDLSRTGTMTIVCPLLGDTVNDESSNRIRARSVAGGHWYLSLVLMRDSIPLWAGPVVTHDVAPDRASVSFGCTSIAKLLDARIVMTAGFEATPAATGADVTLGLDQYSIACILLTLATTGTGRTLPITVPSPSIVTAVLRTYKAVDLASTLERLTQLSEETGGPDIRFRPQVDALQSHLSWAVDVGNPRLGQVDSLWAWDYPTSITSISEQGDSSEMTFRAYVPGNSGGTDTAPPIGVAQDLTYPTAGWPMLERTTRMTGSVEELPILTSQATSYVAANLLPSTTWGIDVDPEAFPEIGTWLLGDNATFTVTNDVWIPNGVYRQRLIGVTHTPSSATLETSAVLVAP